MMVHHLVKRNPRELLKVVRGDNILCPCQGHSSIVPHASINLLLALSPSLTPLWMRSNLLNRSSRRGNPSPFKSKGKKSCLSSLLLDNLHPPPADARKRLVLLSLRTSIHLLVKLGCHLCGKQERSTRDKTFTKRGKKKKKKKILSNRLTFLFYLYSSHNKRRRLQA